MRTVTVVVALAMGLAALCLVADAKADNRCSTCRAIAAKFNEGMAKTKGGHFGGGNTAWEEKKLGDYDMSETRLAEIIEDHGLCGSDKDHDCNRLVESGEEIIEKWWKHQGKDGKPGFEEALCIKGLKVCCPAGHWGKSCKECPGGTVHPCSGKGVCSGDGKRTGNGKCKCDKGYSGETCDTCEEGYYRKMFGESDDPAAFLCEKCPEGCTACNGPILKDCTKCADNYEPAPEGGCQDVDECQTAKKDECSRSQYCANVPGTYACRSCNVVCDLDVGCTGPTPSDCKACAAGYRMTAVAGQEAQSCEDIDECAEGKECPVGKYCFNAKGWAECKACDDSCDAQGCTGFGPSKCIGGCNTGYTKNEHGSCADINECEAASSPCTGENMVCNNTRGAFECVCQAPFQMVDGACVKPKDEL